MQKGKIKAVAFDFGRVLHRWDKENVWRYLSTFTGHTPTEIEQVLSQLAKRHDSGDISSPDFFAEISRKAKLPEDLEYEEFRYIWQNIFSPNSGIEKVLRRIDPKVKRIVISNTDPIHFATIETLPVMKEFFPDPKQYVLSFRVGATKPDSRMWEAGLTLLGMEKAQAKEVLFIDDLMPYIESARQFGFQAEQYDCTRDPIKRLKNILDSFGVLK